MDQLNIICHEIAGLIRGSSVFRAVLRRQFEHLYQFFDGCEFCRIPHQWKLIAAGGKPSWKRCHRRNGLCWGRFPEVPQLPEWCQRVTRAVAQCIRLIPCRSAVLFQWFRPAVVEGIHRAGMLFRVVLCIVDLLDQTSCLAILKMPTTKSSTGLSSI